MRSLLYAAALLAGAVALVACAEGAGNAEAQDLSSTVTVTDVDDVRVDSLLRAHADKIDTISDLDDFLSRGFGYSDEPRSRIEWTESSEGPAITSVDDLAPELADLCANRLNSRTELLVADAAGETIGLARPEDGPEGEFNGIAEAGTHDARAEVNCRLDYEFEDLAVSDFYEIEWRDLNATYSREELDAAGWHLDLEVGG